jgi:ATP-dependent Lhr-like helicase
MVFETLSPQLQKVVQKRFKEPTLPQKLAIPSVASGLNTLIIAPTGSGKTEAALLKIFDKIINDKPKPVSTLYVTPMRALNRDMVDRMLWWGKELELEVSVRHGDTSPYERQLQIEFPPDIMITTLEQLQPMLTGKRIRELLRNVKYLILDEIHETVDSKRGVQLAVALERIRELCGDFQLIMLSATVAQPEEVGAFFSGGRVVNVVKADILKKVEIKAINPKPKSEDSKIATKIFSSKETAARLRTMMDLIKKSRATLVFTNTRDFAEILASRIKMLDKTFPTEIHHSSLSKEVRIKAEKDFKNETLKSLIATSSLQLGIDIGAVDLVLQYMSPRQVTQLIQRVGRSGHELSKVSKGVIITADEDDVFESAVIARKALSNELEPLVFHKNSYDVLAHQLIGLTFDFGSIELEKAYQIVKRAYPYKDLPYAEFLEVCKQLDRLGLVFLDGSIRKKTRGFSYYFENLSTIPNLKQYRVFNMIDNSFVGVLDEEFIALHGEPNTTFIVKGQPWRIITVEGDKVMVEPVEDIEAAIPGWEGELNPVLYDIAQEVGRLRAIIKDKLKEKKSESETVYEIMQLYPVDENCAKDMVRVVKSQMKFGVVPDDKTILIEDFENLAVIHTCCGTNVNETLGRFIVALLTSRVGSVGLKTDPYRIMIQFQQKNVNLIKEVLFNTNPEHLQSYLEMSLTKSELFQWKFVHVAKRFGAISRDAEFGKMRMQRIIDDFAGTPIHKETLKELETEKLDVEKTIDILRKIQNKEISMVFKPGLSPLGKIGVRHKYAEVIGPEKPDLEIFELFKHRLLNTKIRLVCVNCGDWDQVFLVKDVQNDLKCRKCEARTLAVLKHQWTGATKIIKKDLRNVPLTQEEMTKYERIKQRAEIFLVYRRKAALAMAGRGVGPTTAKRILGKYHKDDDDIMRNILEAERVFIRTKRYWSA